MSQDPHADVFSPGELARVAGVAREHVEALLAAGRIERIPGTRFIPWAEAIRSVPELRAAAAAAPVTASISVFSQVSSERASVGTAGTRLSALGSTLLHGSMLMLAVLLSTMNVDSAEEPPRRDEPARMVFLVAPGPAGGGGGGGNRARRPAVKLERTGQQRNRASVPQVTPTPAVVSERETAIPQRPTPASVPVEPRPAAPPPEPLPARVLVAPVASAFADSRDRAGVVAGTVSGAESRGPGDGSGAGSGRGSGSGEGTGAGIGPGSGGGTGGGPYRPGSGVTPPRLLREVKAAYTDEARRRNVTGEVVLEILVRADGSVGDVRIMQGLEAGLDQRAVAAVRQWRFDPARRHGTPVDVLVEVAVEFTLR